MPIKIDDHKKFWDEVVRPDYDEYMADVGNIRRAWHCATSLFHIADWVYHNNKTYIDANVTYTDKQGGTRRVRDERRSRMQSVAGAGVRVDPRHSELGEAPHA